MTNVHIPRDLHQYEISTDDRTAASEECIFTACYEESDIGHSDDLTCSLYGHEIEKSLAITLAFKLTQFIENANLNIELKTDNVDLLKAKNERLRLINHKLLNDYGELQAEHNLALIELGEK